MNQPDKSRERIALTFWMAFILMFFIIQGAVWAFAISFTSNDSSHTVVEGYDEQALSWDEVKRARIESERLGWEAEIEVRDGGHDGNRMIYLKLTDRLGQPITEATFDLRAFHRGAAADKQQLDVVEVGAGIYRSELSVDRLGKWCFSGTASVADQRFIVDRKLQIVSAGEGASE